ncbi:MAG: lipid-A-disaccharide synthase [Chlamydiae bacterium]|jgi:lipid-A-disaccharide synthase|nr:lipid-A-disaccharide synthase [Chlamydiota bacterium]
MSLFVVAGEKSGDAIGAKVLAPLSKQFSIEGVIGPKLKEIGAKELFSIDSFGVMGFVDVLKSLPRFIFLFHKIKKTILKKNPKVVLLIDNAEFSLLLAKSLRKKGFKGKIAQLVSPSVWAWRSSRIKILEKNFDILLSILPFEKSYFTASSLRVEYVGHPLIDELKDYKPQNEVCFLGDKPIIALFPGSRKKETCLNLTLQLKALKNITSHQIAISVASKKILPLIEKILKESNLEATLVFPENRFELMQKADFALSKLGTVNLELAFFNVPTITTFPLPKIEEFLLSRVFKVFLPHYSLVNLLARRRVFPEYVGSFAKLDHVEREIKNFCTAKELKEWSIAGCNLVKKILEEHSFSSKSSHILTNLLLDI